MKIKTQVMIVVPKNMDAARARDELRTLGVDVDENYVEHVAGDLVLRGRAQEDKLTHAQEAGFTFAADIPIVTFGRPQFRERP